MSLNATTSPSTRRNVLNLMSYPSRTTVLSVQGDRPVRSGRPSCPFRATVLSVQGDRPGVLLGLGVLLVQYDGLDVLLDKDNGLDVLLVDDDGLDVLLVEDDGLHKHLSDAIRVAVGRRSPVLQIPEAVVSHSPRDANTGVAVGDTCRELEDCRRLVQSRQAAFIVLSFVRVVHLYVALMLFGQLFDGCIDDAGMRANACELRFFIFVVDRITRKNVSSD